MIVSALVVTTTGLEKWPDDPLSGDQRVVWGTPDASFLPVVTTTGNLREARELYERLSALPGVLDLQLVSWFGEEAGSPPLDDSTQNLLEKTP